MPAGNKNQTNQNTHGNIFYRISLRSNRLIGKCIPIINLTVVRPSYIYNGDFSIGKILYSPWMWMEARVLHENWYLYSPNWGSYEIRLFIFQFYTTSLIFQQRITPDMEGTHGTYKQHVFPRVIHETDISIHHAVDFKSCADCIILSQLV